MELEKLYTLDWIKPEYKWLAIEAELRHEAGHRIQKVKSKIDGRWQKVKVYKTPKELFTFFLDAHYRGMSPDFALSYLLLVGDKLTIWGEGANSKVLETGQLTHFKDGFTGTFPDNDFAAYCVMSRRGIEGKVTRTFSIGDAKRAGLWDDRVEGVDNPGFYKHAKPTRGEGGFSSFWYKYPYRMLEARAWSFAARKLFSDALGGLYTTEEMAGIEEESNPTPVFDEKFSLPTTGLKVLSGDPDSITRTGDQGAGSISEKPKLFDLKPPEKQAKKTFATATEEPVVTVEELERQDKQKFIKELQECSSFSFHNDEHNKEKGHDLLKNREHLAVLYEAYKEVSMSVKDVDYNHLLAANSDAISIKKGE